LMRLYDDELERRGLQSAEVLLTHADIADRGRYLNARRALAELLSRNVVPVINENDTVSVEEIKFGDNDALAAMVVDLVEADLLVILTDAGGVYTSDPRLDAKAERISHLERISAAEEALAGDPGTGLGSGGMLTKLRAARRASEAGVPSAIVPGEPGILTRLLAGEDVGTVVSAQGERRRLRKRWMLDLKARGELRVDDGARAAVIERKKSLLPSGVREVRGTFASGDPVEISTLDGTPFARGLAVYSADEVRRIVGRRSAEIEAALGYRLLDCVVHRDDLVVTQWARSGSSPLSSSPTVQKSRRATCFAATGASWCSRRRMPWKRALRTSSGRTRWTWRGRRPSRRRSSTAFGWTRNDCGPWPARCARSPRCPTPWARSSSRRPVRTACASSASVHRSG